jgi:predicted Rossmann-fold nucleotide-binding protein
MKIAIIGSRNVNPSMEVIRENITKNCSCIVSGGAIGVDTAARKYAEKNKIKFVEFLPDYKKYGRPAPHIRNREIFNYADMIVAFWDGTSRGTFSMIKAAKKSGKKLKVIEIE